MSLDRREWRGLGTIPARNPAAAIDARRWLSARRPLEARGVVKFPVRIKCATLCWNTLTESLRS